MINLQTIIARIEALLATDSQESVTYAALEARLALEAVCYDRLRTRHAYISQGHLKKWQPSAIINRLMEEVDPNVAETYTLSIAKDPVSEGGDPDNLEYLEIGTSIGFEPKKVRSLWNALSKTALHVELPQNTEDKIQIFGDKSKIKNKVLETVDELKRLSKSTMDSTGFGSETSFVCSCGTLNKRRSDLLAVGQVVCCINPDCLYDWLVESKTESECNFSSNSIELTCDNCNERFFGPKRALYEMRFDQQLSCNCSHCGHKNIWMLGLRQMRLAE